MRPATLLMIAAFISGPAIGDDLSGADRLLCSTLQATACRNDGECVSLLPEDLNIPQFVIVDLPAKKLRTTATSGENRQTPIASVHKEEGQIFLQGYELGRAFNLVIHEKSGRASFASVSDGRSVLIFSACTPAR
ncbi:MAG: hypothetical protein KBG75_01410 [Pseudomonadales bacterium]|nr:hypothetical protein [Pseudomonadales bacterium]